MTSYISITALTALLPLMFYVFRFPNGRRFFFWCFLTVGISGSGAWTIVMFSGGWQTGFAPALWLTITSTLLIYAPVAAFYREGHKLASGLLPYLVLLGFYRSFGAGSLRNGF